ncbi:MAG: GlsB/YeaQ/YmgE family stress response membrane protein [Armatimonadetes bacterium]|nr:MAG: GlsB/YeaQ/YmgE family stress response membrane protein [Armatimonadota bacterium]
MNILAWILFGLIVGAVAYYLDPRASSGGILGTMVLGVLGALLGGFLGDLLFGVPVTGFNLSSFLVAIVGALILLWVGRAIGKKA